MKTPLLFLVGLCGVLPSLVTAQESPEALNAPSASEAPRRTDSQLEQLLGPIALYPDALIAIILPASTNISDLALAARFLRTETNATAFDNQPWDESVKSLAHYPEVVKWMDENLEWTKQLGEAFLTQPADVMKTVQRLREQARTVGALTDTPQQRVVVSGQEIAIEPAQDEVIYVPHYDPTVVYSGRNYYDNSSSPYLTFGLGFAVGSWLSYDCDWRNRSIWVGRRHDGSHGYPGPVGRPSGIVGAHTWRPSPTHYHAAVNTHWTARTEVVHPRLIVPVTTVGTRYPSNSSSAASRNPGTHDRREGYLRDSDGREVRRPWGNANPAPAADVPATVNPSRTSVAPALPSATTNNGFRSGDFRREHQREGDGATGVNPPNGSRRVPPSTATLPSSNAAVIPIPASPSPAIPMNNPNARGRSGDMPHERRGENQGVGGAAPAPAPRRFLTPNPAAPANSGVPSTPRPEPQRTYVRPAPSASVPSTPVPTHVSAPRPAPPPAPAPAAAAAAPAAPAPSGGDDHRSRGGR